MAENVDEIMPQNQCIKGEPNDCDHDSNGGSVVPDEKAGLKREMGLVSLIAFLIGSIIGAGIFATPRSVAKYAGSTGAILLVWVGSGMMAVLGAFTWCELALMFPDACGNEYFYLLQAFGSFPAFLSVYFSIIANIPAMALISLIGGDYVMTAIVTGANLELDADDIQYYSKLIAACFIVANMVLHCCSVKWGARTQIFFTSMKLIPITMLIITGFVRLGQGHINNFRNAFNGTSTDVSNIAYALYGGLYSYSGWKSINYLNAESIDPIKHTPLAIYIGIPFVIVCYVLINVGYLTVMTTAEIARSSAVAVVIGQELYGVMHWIIPVMVACSCFSTVNAVSFFISRVLYEAANRKHLPKFLGHVHITRHTPIPAILFSSILSIITLIPEKSNFQNLLKFISFVSWTRIALVVAALLWLRKSRPLMKRPYKVFIGVPILLFICSILVVFLPFYSYPIRSSIGLCIMLPAVPLYFAFIKYQIIPESILNKMVIPARISKIFTCCFGNVVAPDFDTRDTYKDGDENVTMDDKPTHA